jgi:NTP pyrophosphatase (non-canonical NTP hydrolase)
MTLDEYQKRAFATARIDWSNQKARDIPLLGIVGELGSVASEVKKAVRDGKAYTDGPAHLREEFGDLVWYVAAVASRQRITLGSLEKRLGPKAELSGAPFAHLFALMAAVSALVDCVHRNDVDPTPARRRQLTQCLSACLNALVVAVRREKLKLGTVLKENLQKGASKFGDSPADAPAPCFDLGYPDYERLPREMQIQVLELERGPDRVEVILRSREMNIGDRLTDNATRDDGYRYHDVFHFAYAAVLGWSPVIRSLLRSKRKSKPKVDEAQDGARAGIVEEAIAHTVFQYAEGRSFLRSLKHIDHGITQLICRMVRGLEVQHLAMHEWERAIFVGFEAFRALKEHRGGWLLLNAETRSLTYSRDGYVSSQQSDR